jgi:hypothetical protein
MLAHGEFIEQCKLLLHVAVSDQRQGHNPRCGMGSTI